MPAPVELVNTSIQTKLADRDGGTGALARLFLPFTPIGYWYASGLQLTFPRATIPQDYAPTFNGRTKPDTFQKDCCSCL